MGSTWQSDFTIQKHRLLFNISPVLPCCQNLLHHKLISITITNKCSPSIGLCFFSALLNPRSCALNTSINAEWSDFDACLGIKRSTATTIHKIFFASNASFVCATFPGFSSPRFQYHFLSPISKAFAVKSNLQPHVFSKCSLFGITACESKLV